MAPDETADSIAAAIRALPAAQAGTALAATDPVQPGSDLTVAGLRDIFTAQAISRQLDLAARRMQQAGRGYYTIGSAGHEANAAVAAALRATDPALLHYRSGGFYVRRAMQVPGIDPIADVLAGVAAAADEPIAGGRHKVFGRHELAVIPQTSTIASHLPRAVGVAFAIERARKLGVPSAWPADAIAVASAGDASMNHSTALGALNTAAWCGYSGLPLPLLLVCEDNGLGISVRTPAGWIAAAYRSRLGWTYFAVDGYDPVATYEAARAAAAHVRQRRAPAFLHLATVRFYGHAGSDVESAYRSPAEIAADRERDPLFGTARALIAAGDMADDVAKAFTAAGDQVAAQVGRAMSARPLAGRLEVMAPLAPYHPELIAAQSVSTPSVGRHDDPDPSATPATVGLTLAQSVNQALRETLQRHRQAVAFGEDVGRKGGVYGVTRGLQAAFGAGRVFDTVLDEQSILGLALGLSVSGLLPIPEIQYLAYLHNAEDQLRGEAASLQFFSRGQYRNPMVLRVAGYAYQKGFGGHFHNDDSVAVLRDIPGVIIAAPARGDDAVAMLRTCVAAALVDGSVCVITEPIALYHTRDLYEPDDGGWLTAYPAAVDHVPVGRARVHGEGGDLTIVTFGNGLYLSLRAARRLAEAGIGCRIVDLRWLAPLPVADVLAAAAATGRVLVVDETRRSGGVAEGVLAGLVDAGFTGPMARVAAADSFVPLGAAANLVLVSEDEIVAAGTSLVRR